MKAPSRKRLIVIDAVEFFSSEVSKTMTLAETGAFFRRLNRAVLAGERDAPEIGAPFVVRVFWCTAKRPHVPVSIRRHVYERDGYCCVLCGSDSDLSLDHIKHFSAGGPDTVENFRLLCMTCNRKRGNRQ